MKNSTVKYILFIGAAYLLGNHTVQAYKLYCPSPEFIELNDVNHKFEYSAPMQIKENKNEKKIVMKAKGKEKLDVSSFTLQAANISSDNKLSCLYGESKDSNIINSITLIASLPKESNCSVIYPNGHEYPELIYFECSDSMTEK